uniref:Uncharacterized protein n=1 Tax=viral metagenome TaxID=1070528 RepID=A0A6M3JIE7_9ZZZZ
MKLFFAVMITLSFSSAFWIDYYANEAHKTKMWKVEREKMINEIAKHRADAAEARKERNRYIYDYVERRK